MQVISIINLSFSALPISVYKAFEIAIFSIDCSQDRREKRLTGSIVFICLGAKKLRLTSNFKFILQKHQVA